MNINYIIYSLQNLYDVTDYISNQSELTPKHRAIVVNWLVSLQDLFCLNHEVLYMAVKVIDLYLMKHDTIKDKFQLLASGAILISSKIDVSMNESIKIYLCLYLTYFFFVGEGTRFSI